MAEPEDEAPPILLPCSFCTRTFKPESLDKHLKVCEKQASKKRKVFDSSKQRIQGTELAEFLPKILREKKNEKVVTKKPESKWKEKHLEFVAAIRAARGVETAPAPVPKSSNERCPHCDRNFGPKAFDRHIEWCKDQKARIPKSPASIQAKERLEARTKYRAPPLAKSKRTLTREKYARVSSSKESSPLGSRSAVAFTKPLPPDVKVSETTSRIQGIRNKPKLSSSSPSCTLPSGNMQMKRREPSPSPSKRSFRSNSKTQRKAPVMTRNEETNNHASLFSSSCNITRMRPSEERRRGREVKPSAVENRPCSRKVSLTVLKPYKRRAEPAKRPLAFGTHSSKCQDESKRRSTSPDGSQELLLGESLHVKGSLIVMGEIDSYCDPAKKSRSSRSHNSKNEILKLNDIEVNTEVEGLTVSPCFIYPLNSSSVTWKEVAKNRIEDKRRGDSDMETDECYTTVTASSFTDEDIQTCKKKGSSHDYEHLSSEEEITSDTVCHEEELKFCADSPQYVSGDSLQERDFKPSKGNLEETQVENIDCFSHPQEISVVTEFVEHKQKDISGLSECENGEQKSVTENKDLFVYPDTCSDKDLEDKDVDNSHSFIKNVKYLKKSKINHDEKHSSEKKCREKLESHDIHFDASVQEIHELPDSNDDNCKLQKLSPDNTAQITDWQKLRRETGSLFLCSETFNSETEFDKQSDRDFDSSFISDIINDIGAPLIEGKEKSSFLQESSDVFEPSQNSQLSTDVHLVDIVDDAKTLVANDLNIFSLESLSDVKDNKCSGRQNNLSYVTDDSAKGLEEQKELRYGLQEETCDEQKIHDRTFSVTEFVTCDSDIDHEHYNDNLSHHTEIVPNWLTEGKNLSPIIGPQTDICVLSGDARKVQISESEEHLKHHNISSPLVEFCEDSNVFPVGGQSDSMVSKEELKTEGIVINDEVSQVCGVKFHELEENKSSFESALPTAENSFCTSSSAPVNVSHFVPLVCNDPNHQNNMQSSIRAQTMFEVSDSEARTSCCSSVGVLEERNINRCLQTAIQDISTNINCNSSESGLMNVQVDRKEKIKINNSSVSEDINCEKIVSEHSANNCLPNLGKDEACLCGKITDKQDYSLIGKTENDLINEPKCMTENNLSSCKKSCVCCFEKVAQQKEINVQPHFEEEELDFLNKYSLLDNSTPDRSIDSRTDKIWDLASQEFIEAIKKNPINFSFKSNEITKLNSSTQVNENDIFELCKTSYDTSGENSHNFCKMFHPITPVSSRAHSAIHKYKSKANLKKLHRFKKKQRKKFLNCAKKSYEREEPEVKKRLLHDLSEFCDPFHSSVISSNSMCKILTEDSPSGLQSLYSENLSSNLENQDNTFDSSELILSNYDKEERFSNEISENILFHNFPPGQDNNSLKTASSYSGNSSIDESCSYLFFRTSNSNENSCLKSSDENISSRNSFYLMQNEVLITTITESKKRELALSAPKTYIHQIDPSVFIDVFDIMKYHVMTQLLFSELLRYVVYPVSACICCNNRSLSKQCGIEFEKCALQSCYLPNERSNNYRSLSLEFSREMQKENNVSVIQDSNETCVGENNTSCVISILHKKNLRRCFSKHGYIPGDWAVENKLPMINYPCLEIEEVDNSVFVGTEVQKEREECGSKAKEPGLLTCNGDFTSVECLASTSSADKRMSNDFIGESKSYISIMIQCEKNEVEPDALTNNTTKHFSNETQMSHKNMETETVTCDFQKCGNCDLQNKTSTSQSSDSGKDESIIVSHSSPNFLSNIETFKTDEHEEYKSNSKFSSDFVGESELFLSETSSDLALPSLEYFDNTSSQSRSCPLNSVLEIRCCGRKVVHEKEEIIEDYSHDTNVPGQSLLKRNNLDEVVDEFPSKLSVMSSADDNLLDELVYSSSSDYLNNVARIDKKCAKIYNEDISECDKIVKSEIQSLELVPINFNVPSEDNRTTTRDIQEIDAVESATVDTAAGSNISVPEFLSVSNSCYQQNELHQMLRREIQLLEKCIFSVNLPSFLFNEDDKDEELNVKIWIASIKIPPKNDAFLMSPSRSLSITSTADNEEALKKTAFEERLAENMCRLQQNIDNAFELSGQGISNYSVVADTCKTLSTTFFKGARKSISDSHCSCLTDRKTSNRPRKLKSEMSLYDLAKSAQQDSVITQSDRVAFTEKPGNTRKKHKIKSAEEHDTSFLKLVEKWSTKDNFLKRSQSVETLNRKSGKEYVQLKRQIPKSHRLPPLPSPPKSSSQSSGSEEIYDPYVSAERQMKELLSQGDSVRQTSQNNKSTHSSQPESCTVFPSFESSHRSAFVSPEPRIFPSSKSHFEKGDADKRMAEETYVLKCESSASSELYSQPKSYSAGGKFSADSAYGSLNRRSPIHSASQMPSKHEDLEAERMCFMSSSSSESSLPPLCSVQVTKREASNPSLSPTSSRAVDASPVMQNVPRMSKFCHECGSKFPVSLAKFCCECGVRRLAM